MYVAQADMDLLLILRLLSEIAEIMGHHTRWQMFVHALKT